MDDITLAEAVPRGDQNGMQATVNAVEQWSIINKLQLNAEKCKELAVTCTVNSQELKQCY